MSRRLVAFLIALGLAAALIVTAALQPVPWVRFRPGPTINVLGKLGDTQLVEVSGRKTYPDTGALRMVTIIPDGPTDNSSLLSMMFSWANPNDAVLPKEAVYPKHQTSQQAQQESAAEMSSSQDAATAAALTALKIPFSTEVSVQITAVDAKGAAADKLKTGDLLVAVDGKGAKTQSGFIALVRAANPGTELPLTVLRDGERKTVEVTTRPNPEKPTESRVGVSLGPLQLKLKIPFKVKFQLSDNIGGPSAGMMFALSLYDLLTPGSLTGGTSIAGTGTIDPDGVVGPIGGIGQKLVGAQNDGARLFLVADENCAEAVRSHYDKNKLRLVRVHTLTDAIDALDTYRKDPNAALPRCTR
jgi:PDZ domain-containing protein